MALKDGAFTYSLKGKPVNESVFFPLDAGHQSITGLRRLIPSLHGILISTTELTNLKTDEFKTDIVELLLMLPKFIYTVHLS